jgi:hypothetical protein
VRAVPSRFRGQKTVRLAPRAHAPEGTAATGTAIRDRLPPCSRDRQGRSVPLAAARDRRGIALTARAGRPGAAAFLVLARAGSMPAMVVPGLSDSLPEAPPPTALSFRARFRGPAGRRRMRCAGATPPSRRADGSLNGTSGSAT